MNLMGFNFDAFSGVTHLIIYFFVFLVITLVIVSVVILVTMGKKSKKVIEINQLNKVIRQFNGRIKKRGESLKLFWARKIGRFLPDFQQKSVFIGAKNKETFILLKDNNGFYHSLRIPTYNELKKWYKIVHNIDLDNDKTIENQRIKDIYFLPNPHEDLEYLANAVVEADNEFKINHWWQSPTIAYIGVGFICFLMIVMTLLLGGKYYT